MNRTATVRLVSIVALATVAGYRMHVDLRPSIAAATEAETVRAMLGFQLRTMADAFLAVFSDPVTFGAFAFAMVLVWPWVRAPY